MSATFEVTSLTTSLALFGLGIVLRRTVCTEVDGITAKRLALWITLPALILQHFRLVGSNVVPTLVSGVVYAVSTVLLPGVLAWSTSRQLHPKERGVIAGVSVGSSMELISLPFVAAVFGSEGIQVALGCCLINILATTVMSTLYFSTAGPAFPKDFAHTDGGVYNGEWKGALKDGFGVYKYPSGAKYEGEWLDGTKEGRGVYTFAKGGIYEGEWRNGKMEGVGVRTFSSGKVKSGIWKSGTLEKQIDESQCALVVANANEAAVVARSVFVGPIGLDHVVLDLFKQPALLAFAVAILLSVLGMPLTPSLDTVSMLLSKAHAPLALLAMGLLLEVDQVEERHVKQVWTSLGTRLLPPLLVYAVCAGLTTTTGFLSTISLCTLSVCSVAPLSTHTLALSHIFRLNENLVAAISRQSNVLSISLSGAMLLASRQALITSSLTPLIAVLLGTAAIIGSLVWYLSSDKPKSLEERTVKMVYQGAHGATFDENELPQQLQEKDIEDKKEKGGGMSALPSRRVSRARQMPLPLHGRVSIAMRPRPLLMRSHQWTRMQY